MRRDFWIELIKNTGLLFWSVYFILPYKEYSSKPLLFFFLLTGLLSLWIWAVGYKGNEETPIVSSGLFKTDRKSGLFFAGALFILVAMNFKFLNAPIAWMGDEDFHIYRAFFFLQFVKTKALALKPLFILLPIFYTAIFLLRFYGRIKLSFLSSITIPLIIFAIIWSLFTGGGNYKDAFLRYPPLLMVFQSFLVVLWTHSEIAHRMVAFIPFLGIFFLIFKYLEPITGRFNAALSSLVFATIPNLFYFSTIVYLEQGALLFIALSLFFLINIEEYDNNNLKIVAALTGFSGFCKETMVPFLVVMFITLLIIEIRKSMFEKQKAFPVSMLSILHYGILIFSPILPYLLIGKAGGVYVKTLGNTGIQILKLNWNNLIDIKTYVIFLKGIIFQFTLPIVIICILGLLAGFFIKKYRYVSFVGFMSLLLGFLFIVQNIVGIGFSRYNLTFLPLFFIGFIIFFSNLFREKGMLWATGILVLLLSINLFSSPMSFKDRKNWGSPTVDMAEYYYPYNKALKWIAEENPQYKILICGQKYPYFVEFYRFKYKIVNEIMQDIGEISPVLAIKKAIERKADILILHNNPQTHILLTDEIKQYLVSSFELEGNFLDVIRIATDKKIRLRPSH